MNRRHFLFGSLAAPLLAATKKATLLVERPNIVLIVAQDLGAYMVGCYGNTEIRTPNIDRLAQIGVRFAAHFSSNAPVPDSAPFSGAGFNCGRAESPDQASAFLDAQAPAKPFFLTVVWPSPTTVTAPQKNVDLYAAVSFESVGWEAIAANATHKDMLRNPQGTLRKYAASLTTLDEQLAPLRDKLQQRGLQDNTLVIFTSISGFLLGHHGMWGGTGASNPPNFYEEAVRTPLIWCWPSRFPPQTMRNDVVNSYDLMPALSQLAGIGQGLTYLPFVYGRSMPKKQIWPDIAFARIEDAEMARDNRYKLIARNQGKGPNELYDEVADGREFNNEFDNPKFSGKRERLTAELAERQPKK